MHYLFESAFCLVIFYAFYWLALRKETFFQWNRAYLLLAPLLAFGIPALHFGLEAQPDKAGPLEWQGVSRVVQQTQLAPLALQHQLEQPAPLPGNWALSLGEMLGSIYKLGALLLGLLLAARLTRLAQFIRRCRRARHAEGFVLAETPPGEAAPIASFFHLVFFQKNQMTENERLIVAHELVHARQWHSLDVLLMELMIVWQWFNPLIWAYRRSLRQVHEYIADAYVVERHARHAYATLLVQQHLAGAASTPPILLTTFHSQLKNRLRMLSKRPSHWLRRGKFALALPLAGALMLLFSFRLIEKLPAAAPLLSAIDRADNWMKSMTERPVAAPVSTVAVAAPAPQTEPSPYIFYWGCLQARLYHNESTDEYFGEIHTALPALREAIKREPRLWDGHSLAQKLSFLWEDLRINSDYNDEAIYAACRKAADDKAATMAPEGRVKIGGLLLPGGKTAEVFLFFDAVTPSWLPRRSSESNWRSDPGQPVLRGEAYLDWGEAGEGARERQFFTVSEFWNLMELEPMVHRKDGQIVPAQGLSASIRQGRDYLKRRAAEIKANTSWADFRAYLEEFRPQIGPGTTIYLDWETEKPTLSDTMFMLDPQVPGLEKMSVGIPKAFLLNSAEVARFDLVADNDPRLSLRYADEHSYSFEWGNYATGLYDKYAREFVWRDTVVQADRSLTIENYSLTRRELLEMVKLRARIYRGETALDNIAFTFQYGDQTAEIRDGLCPKDMLRLLEQNLKPQDVLVLTQFQAAKEVSLKTVTIRLEVKSDDPKPPLRPSYAPSDAPIDQQVRLFLPMPNPANDQVRIAFALPGDMEVTLRLTDAQGKEVWSEKAAYPKGENSKTLSSSVLRTSSGFHLVTLETPAGTVQERLVVAH